MKKILSLLCLILTVKTGISQITRIATLVKEPAKTNTKADWNYTELFATIINSPIPDSVKAAIANTAGLHDETQQTPIDKSSSIPYFAISGLGSISSTSDQIKSVDPAANIACNISLQKNRAWVLYLNYNIGTNIDTTSKDSLSLPAIFFPDKSKSGFTAGLSFDVFRLLGKYKYDSGIATLRNVRKIDNSDSKFYYYTLEPYYEYSYTRRTLKADSAVIVPRIETSTHVIGIRLTGNIVLDKNSFSIVLNPYLKFITVTNGTFNTYNGLFLTKNNNVQLPHSVSFFGANVNLQINKTILGFTYENLLHKKIFDNINKSLLYLWGK